MHEFLVWADLRFTAQVFEAEARREGMRPQRRHLATELVRVVGGRGGDIYGACVVVMHGGQGALEGAAHGDFLRVNIMQQSVRPRYARVLTADPRAGRTTCPQGMAGADGLNQPLLMTLLAAMEGSRGSKAAELGPLVPGGQQAPDGGADDCGLISAGLHQEEGSSGSGGGGGGGGSYSASEEDEGGEQDGGGRRDHAGHQLEERRLRGQAAGASADRSESVSGRGGSETEELEGGSSSDTLGLPGLGAGAARPAAHLGGSSRNFGLAGASAGEGMGMVPPDSPPESHGGEGSSGAADSRSHGAHSGGSWGDCEAASPGQGHLPLHIVPVQPARKLAPLVAAPKGAAAAFEDTAAAGAAARHPALAKRFCVSCVRYGWPTLSAGML